MGFEQLSTQYIVVCMLRLGLISDPFLRIIDESPYDLMSLRMVNVWFNWFICVTIYVITKYINYHKNIEKHKTQLVVSFCDVSRTVSAARVQVASACIKHRYELLCSILLLIRMFGHFFYIYKLIFMQHMIVFDT